jgi:uncharacterized membrane protein
VDELERKKRIRRTTLIFVAVALAFYIGYIMMGVVRS